MVIGADTSFLFSLYGNDCHSSTAVDWIRKSTQPIVIGALTDFELRNSFLFSESRGFNPGDSAAIYLKNYRAALEAGRVAVLERDLALVVTEATRLSATYTLTGGHRSFDILHVAAAKIMAATHFLTFNVNQKALAENEGLVVPF
jgi:predicted nucleic acid-binding protein